MIHSYEGREFSVDLSTSEIKLANQEEGLKAISAHINSRGDFVEILYFLGGETSYFIEGEFCELEFGDVVFSNATEIHGIVHRASCNYKRLVIKVKPDFFLINNIEDILNVLNNKYPGEGNHIGHQTPMGRILNSKTEELMNYLSTSEISPTKVVDMVVEILKLIASGVSRFVKDVPNPLMRKIIDYIVENVHDDIGLNSIAEKFYIDRTHLARIFKNFTNCSVNKFITVLRFEHINQLRYFSGLSLTEAVRVVGFKNYSSFYRAFKKYYGRAPKKTDLLQFNTVYFDLNGRKE